MNRIIIDRSEVRFIEVNDDISIDISNKSKVVLNILLIKDASISINVDGELIINAFLYKASCDVSVNLLDGAILRYNNAIVASKYCKMNVVHDVNSHSYIVNHGVNLEGQIIDVDVVIKDGANNCFSNQDNRIINMKDETGVIIPKLLVSSKDVNLSHSAYIGNFDKNVVFYMMSRGIDIITIKELLVKGFLFDKMELDDDLVVRYLDMLSEVIIYE